MFTRDSSYFTSDTFLHEVVKINPITLSRLVSIQCGDWQYQTRGSIGNALSIITNGNVFVASWVLPLVTRLFFDFVMIHCISRHQ